MQFVDDPERLTDTYGAERRTSMNDSLREIAEDRALVDETAEIPQSVETPQPRAVGSPLPMGGSFAAQSPQPPEEPRRLTSVPPPARALAKAPAPSEQTSTLQRAVKLIRTALPFVQRMLPLLEGGVGATLANLLNPPPPPAPPAAPPANLAPIEEGLLELRSQHRELRNLFVEQNSSLKRVEDQLEMVREATDRNTLEQQELLEDLKAVGSKVNLVALVAIGLLAFSVLLNLLLYMHIQRVLP
jgi:hypothetical protein